MDNINMLALAAENENFAKESDYESENNNGKFE